MKSQLRTIKNNDITYQALYFVCPGCEAMDGGSGAHLLPVNTEEKKPSWTWDGNLDAPTLSPSILTHYEYGEKKQQRRCHSFLRNGIFEFLSDCTHELKNQHVPIPDMPEWMIDE